MHRNDRKKSSKPESIELKKYSQPDAFELLIKMDRQRKEVKTGTSKHTLQHMHTHAHTYM